MSAWENRAQELLANKEPLWKLKADLSTLALEDLDPILSTMTDMGAQVQCRDDIVGLFNTGGPWGRHTAVDLRYKPCMSAMRMSQLVRHHLRALTNDNCPIKIWQPLSQGEMTRKRKRTDGAKGKAAGKGRDGAARGRGRDDRRERRRSRERR